MSTEPAQLVSTSCTPCRGGIPPLTPDEAKAHLRQTPEWALLATLVMACGLAATGTFRELIAVASFIFVVNHCFAFVAMFVLRRREPGLARPFRVWGYPWATSIVLIAAVGFLGGSLVSDTKHSLYALGLIGISFPLFGLLRRARLNAVN